MPVHFLDGLTNKRRTPRSNRQLGAILAFVAGAINAGGFLAVHRYTSHMTGIVSAIADDIVLGNAALVFAGFSMVCIFMLGAMTTSLSINWARRQQLEGEYALSLMLESGLLLIFGLLGVNLQMFGELFVPATVLLLCFIMGLQNAIVTKISRAEIRTTHMTGVVTDLGIELGRLIYVNARKDLNTVSTVKADRNKLAIHATILLLFVAGGITGAFMFRAMGFSATIPIALCLMIVAAPPLWRDVWRILRR